MRGRKGERAVEISRFYSAPAAKIYIFGAKGGKEGKEEGERIFFVDLGSHSEEKTRGGQGLSSSRKDQWEETFLPLGRITLLKCGWLVVGFNLGLCYQ